MAFFSTPNTASLSEAVTIPSTSIFAEPPDVPALRVITGDAEVNPKSVKRL